MYTEPTFFNNIRTSGGFILCQMRWLQGGIGKQMRGPSIIRTELSWQINLRICAILWVASEVANPYLSPQPPLSYVPDTSLGRQHIVHHDIKLLLLGKFLLLLGSIIHASELWAESAKEQAIWSDCIPCDDKAEISGHLSHPYIKQRRVDISNKEAQALPYKYR